MLTAGTLGVTAGVMVLVGCLVAAAPEPEATVEFLSEPHDGLESGADEGPEAGTRTGVSEPDWPSLQSAAAESLLEDAEERKWWILTLNTARAYEQGFNRLQQASHCSKQILRQFCLLLNVTTV